MIQPFPCLLLHARFLAPTTTNRSHQSAEPAPAAPPPKGRCFRRAPQLTARLTYPQVPFKAIKNARIFSLLLQNHPESCRGHRFLWVTFSMIRDVRSYLYCGADRTRLNWSGTAHRIPPPFAQTGKALSNQGDSTDTAVSR